SRRFTVSASRASDGKDSTALLRCGISTWPMSALGHQRSRASKPHERACPLHSKSGQANACLDMSANSDPMSAAAKKRRYSITWSALASSAGGRPPGGVRGGYVSWENFRNLLKRNGPIWHQLGK